MSSHKLSKGLELLAASNHEEAIRPPAEPSKEELIDDFCVTYTVDPKSARQLCALGDYQVTIIADDSGSMAAASDCQQEGVGSRWDEQRMMTNMLVALCNIVDKDGVDVCFLNRGVVGQVRSAQDARLVQSFATPPSGGTPLTETLSYVLNRSSNNTFEDGISGLKRKTVEKKLIFIVTDGCPTKRGSNESDVKGFRKVLASRDSSTSFISIVACTGDKKTMAYLNKWDKEIPHLDVIDDFISEREEVRRVNGRHHPFSYGDYVVKALLAPLDDRYDRLDETVVPLEFGPGNIRIKPRDQQGCCVIL